MTEIVLRDIDPHLAERIRRIAEARHWSMPQALKQLLEHGLFAVEAELNVRFDDTDAGALQAAIAALEQVPNDPGFALIGRAPAANQNQAPDQTIHASFSASGFDQKTG